jgi:hypothetical protein
MPGTAAAGGIRRRLGRPLVSGWPLTVTSAMIGQKLGGAVLALDLLEQLRRRVDEPGRVGIVDGNSDGR